MDLMLATSKAGHDKKQVYVVVNEDENSFTAYKKYSI